MADEGKKATDGAATETPDELAARRGKDSDPLAEGNGKSTIEERGAEGGTDEEDDGQFAFVTEEGGKKVTLGTLIKRGVSIEYKITMGSKSNVLKGTLLDPEDTNHLLLVRGVVGDVKVSFTRDDREEITKATVYVEIKPKVVVNAKTEQAEVMLHGEPAGAAAEG